MNFPNPLYISNPAAFIPEDNHAWMILPTGPPEFSAPIPGDSTEYILRQQFCCLRKYFTSLALSTPYGNFDGGAPDFPDPNYGDFILVGESEPKEIDGGVCVFWRTYAKLPPIYRQPTSITYTFIGYSGSNLVGGFAAVNPREQFSQTVFGAVESEFFLLGPAPTLGPVQEFPYTVYGSILDIPQTFAQKYLSADNAAAGLVTVGETPVERLISEASALVARTNPSLEQYIGWTGWDYQSDPPTFDPAQRTEIIAQDGSIEPWGAAPMGKIMERKTIKIYPI